MNDSVAGVRLSDTARRSPVLLIALSASLAGTALVVIPVGPLSLLVVIALSLSPVLILTWKSVDSRPLRSLVLIWLAVIVVSSTFHFLSWRPTLAQGLYPVGIAAVALFFLWGFREFKDSILKFSFSVGLGLGAGVLLQPVGIGENQHFLKTGITLAAIICLLSLVGNRASSVIVITMILAFSAYLFVSDFRSGGALLLMTYPLYALLRFAFYGSAKSPRVIENTAGRPVVGRFPSARISLSLLFGLVLTGSIAFGYSEAASSGLLGEAALERFEQQAEATGGLVAGARPELIVAWNAITPYWLEGRGGNPAFAFEEQVRAISSLIEAGVVLSPSNLDRVLGDGINSHSLMFNSWVIHGVAGVIPWMLLLILIARGMVASIGRGSPTALLLTYGFLQTTWDCFFSPWSPRMEVWLGLLIAMAIQEVSSRLVHDYSTANP